MNGRILLIRHSLTEANEKKLYCGKTDLPLSLRGRSLAHDMAEEFKNNSLSDAKFFTSGMRRTDETVALLFGNVQFESVSEFREMDFGDFEMQSYAELKEKADYKEWIKGDNLIKRCPGGESSEEMTKRALGKISEIIIRYQNAVIVTHGGVIAAIMTHFFVGEEKNRYQWQPEPCRGYCLQIENGVPTCYYKI